MSCSSAAASQAQRGRSSVCGGKGGAAGGGGPFLARRRQVSCEGVGVQHRSMADGGAGLATCFCSGGEVWAHKWGGLSGPVPDT